MMLIDLTPVSQQYTQYSIGGITNNLNLGLV